MVHPSGRLLKTGFPDELSRWRLDRFRDGRRTSLRAETFAGRKGGSAGTVGGGRIDWYVCWAFLITSRRACSILTEC